MNSREPQVIGVRSKKIVFNVVRGVNYFSLHFQSILAKALAIRGHKVFLLLDDHVLNHCDTAFYDSNRKQLCTRCSFSRKLLLRDGEDFGKVKYVTYSKLLESIEPNLPANNVDLESFVQSSGIRHFRMGRLDAGMSEQYLNESREVARLSIKIGKSVCQNIAPDIFITEQPVYVTWGPIYDYLLAQGVDCVNYRLGSNKLGNVNFNRKIKEGFRCFDSYWPFMLKRELSLAEKNKIVNYMKGRENNQGVELKLVNDYRKYPGFEEKIKLDHRLPTFAIFPNKTWESTLLNETDIFESLFDWLFETVQYFIDHPNKNLIIKLHPVEECYMVKSQKSIGQFLLEKFPDLAKQPNIIILPSNTSINPYRLFSYIDAGLILNGTLALEMAYKGIPVLVAGRAHYSGKGFLYDIRSKKDYFSLFDQLEEIKRLQADNYDKLMKYLFLYFLLWEIPLAEWFTGQYDALALCRDFETMILPGKNKILDHICDCITDSNKYFPDWYYAANLNT
jgi:hypothetical protein